MRVVGVAAVCLFAGPLLTGCGSGAVDVPRFRVTAAGHDGCAQLLKSLPKKVADQTQRRTTGSVYAAAYGDPAIVLRCGVEKPADETPTAICLTARGLGWIVPPAQIDDLGADVVMTLIKRSFRVDVTIPAHYRPNGPTEAMVDLASTLKAHTTATGRCH